MFFLYFGVFLYMMGGLLYLLIIPFLGVWGWAGWSLVSCALGIHILFRINLPGDQSFPTVPRTLLTPGAHLVSTCRGPDSILSV